MKDNKNKKQGDNASPIISNLRSSLPNFISRPKNVFKDLNINTEGENSINENLMKYKEIKMLYKKTGIKPIYFLYALIVALILVFIGFFESQITFLIATLYPLYISIKTIQSGDKEEIEKWLTYW